MYVCLAAEWFRIILKVLSFFFFKLEVRSKIQKGTRYNKWGAKVGSQKKNSHLLTYTEMINHQTLWWTFVSPFGLHRKSSSSYGMNQTKVRTSSEILFFLPHRLLSRLSPNLTIILSSSTDAPASSVCKYWVQRLSVFISW